MIFPLPQPFDLSFRANIVTMDGYKRLLQALIFLNKDLVIERFKIYKMLNLI